MVKLTGKSMINDTEIDVNAITITNTNKVKLQTEVSETTKDYLRMESIRRHITMGQLLDKMVKLFFSGDVPKITS